MGVIESSTLGMELNLFWLFLWWSW